MRDTLFDERRLVSRVLRHWEEMALGRDLPGKDNIDPWLIGDDWSYCMLVSLNGDDGKPRFLMVGGNLLPADADSLYDKPIAECPSGTIPAALLTQLDRCVAASRPLNVSGGALHLGKTVLFRALLMPLSSDGRAVDTIFGAANFRPLAAGEDRASHPIEVVPIED
jgi:hypothetical protein